MTIKIDPNLANAYCNKGILKLFIQGDAFQGLG